MSLTERREMIRKKNAELSRSSLYYTPVGVNAEPLKLMHEIDRVFTKYPFFGSHQIAAYLLQSGFSAVRHRARRLTGIMGLGDAHDTVLPALKYAGCQLLCCAAGGGHFQTRQARDHAHGSGQPIYRLRLDHNFD